MPAVESSVQLKRVAAGGDTTWGVLCDDSDTPFAVTVERPWLNNKKGESCIPIGTYTCRRVDSPKFGNTFEVTDVEGRSHILFHKGNINDDSHGCIIVAESFNPVKGQDGITGSKEGFGEFMSLLTGRDEFTLYVTEVW